MLENLIPFEDQIKKTLDKIIEDYGNFRSKDSQATVDLQSVLKKVPGSYGVILSETHSIFKGVNILKANEKFQSKGIIEVLELIKGTDFEEVKV